MILGVYLELWTEEVDHYIGFVFFALGRSWSSLVGFRPNTDGIWNMLNGLSSTRYGVR